LIGWFTVFWADGEPGTHLGYEEYWLTADDGKLTRLQIEPALLQALGGSDGLNGQWVSVQGTWITPESLQVTSLQLQPTTEAHATAAPLKPEVIGSQPWITLLCKFSDIGTEPQPVSYFTEMYSSTWPGLDHYWREVSYDLADVQGSGSVTQWYTLPHTRSYYLLTGDYPDTAKLFQDCTAVADADVYFPNYVGINMMFNSSFSVGVGGYGSATLDGVTRTWYRTWEPEWGYENIAVMEHEMGHGFGLPHSSGNYGETYDNVWDVMSDTWTNCARLSDPVYGCIGQHTIGWHKDREGWIATNKKATILAGSQTTLTLERLALPQTSNYLVAYLPVRGAPDRFYTLEARRNAGYDMKLAGEGVIIHYVEIGRTNPARVIDIDGNGNTNDAGAMWTIGETFSDTVNGITVTVVSATATGYVINANNQSFATRYYVATTGSDSGNSCLNSATPCASVQHAVDVAEVSGEIRIAAGTYTPTAGITWTVYLSKTVVLLGGYSTSNWDTAYPLTQTTTLDAQGQGRVIYIASGQPTLQGLRLVNGDATGLGGTWGDDGGGIYVHNGASPTIRNCIISNNSAQRGGGLFLAQSAGIVEANLIMSNTASQYGGGVLSLYSDASTFARNVLRGNQSNYQGGGIYLYGTDSQLTNNIIVDNSAASNGSGIYIRNATLQLWHNTVARNTGGSGSGIHLDNSNATLMNTILAGHTIGLNASAGSTATLAATLWGSGAWANSTDWSGGGSVSIGTINIHADPAFLSPATGDYHLDHNSAAIDQGVDTGITIDVDEQVRPNGSAPDLGADEWYKRFNQAPLTPTNPSPALGELDVWILRTLSWQSSDPDGESVTYTVALGPSNPPGVVGQTDLLSFDPGQLLTGTHYYWKITATDGVSATVGPLWDFTTRSDAVIYRTYLPLVLRWILGGDSKADWMCQPDRLFVSPHSPFDISSRVTYNLGISAAPTPTRVLGEAGAKGRPFHLSTIATGAAICQDDRSWDMTLLEQVQSKREDILRLAARRGARNVRLFGSVARCGFSGGPGARSQSARPRGTADGFAKADGVQGGCGNRSRPTPTSAAPRASRGPAIMRDESERLRDILEAIERIEKYAARGRAVFDEDELIQTWVVHHIEVIGEACRALPDEFQARYAGVPWSDIIGMRNILVHHYFGIDPDAVWAVVEHDLPDLKLNVQAILREWE
jgi:M6 family metalloprotease-like protein